ncbi:Protein aspartic protease in guard cell 1 [Apostasia shenzhenica]|uniref:Protein aspartic protease in guard cell 1 n=1 Tax=Apostasia shenzhenica TaxID=1088818 RepID=A0A2I0A1U1_9ASPA|nr:Protein aspartic protease in guard cell 1 [Apostasia shenzhenica]
MHLLPFFSFLLLLLLPFSIAAGDPCAATPSASGDIPLLHVNSKCSPFSFPPANPTLFDSVLELSRRVDPFRLSFLSSLAASSVPVASGQHILDSAIYILQAGLGSPPHPLLLALDSAADASFISAANFSSSSAQILPCSSPVCPLFNGQACAAAAAAGPCIYNQSYGGDSSFSAALSQDSLILSRDTITSFIFGAVTAAAAGPSFPKHGLLGLGRGPISLLSQTSSLYHSVFSYCLPSYNSYYFSGSLRLGPARQPPRIHSTPLLFNPHRPSLYYVNLTGVSVGRVPVAVPPRSFAFDPQTGAGTVVDAGTVITRFVAPAYTAVRDEFRRQVNASGGYESLGAFDTCFSTAVVGTAASPPAVTLHLEGLNLVLPAENALIHSSWRSLACLAMAPAPANVNAVVNVIASYQQQNHRVLVDVPGGRVGFARELCS